VSYIRVGKKGYAGVYFRMGVKGDRCYYIVYRDRYKKQVHERVGWDYEGYTAAMARNIRQERIQAIRHGKELPNKIAKVTFGEAWSQYKESLELHGKNTRVPDSYYRNWLEPRFKDKLLDEISPKAIENLQRAQVEAGLAVGTVNNTTTLIRRVFNRAIRSDVYTGTNPVTKVTYLQGEVERERFLTYDEAKRLLDALADESEVLHDMAYLSLTTGLRQGEILKMVVRDLDFENQVITIQDTKGRNGSSSRVAMSGPVRDVLSKYTENKNLNDKVFDTSLTFRNTYARVVNQLGLNDEATGTKDKVVFHTLRHTFASWLAIEGESIITIKELMRHKTIEMTLRYAHLMPDTKLDAVNRLAEKLGT